MSFMNLSNDGGAGADAGPREPDAAVKTTAYFLQRTGPTRCVRCDFVVDDSVPIDKHDYVLRAHLEACHPGWLTDGVHSASRTPPVADPLLEALRVANGPREAGPGLQACLSCGVQGVPLGADLVCSVCEWTEISAMTVRFPDAYKDRLQMARCMARCVHMVLAAVGAPEGRMGPVYGLPGRPR